MPVPRSTGRDTGATMLADLLQRRIKDQGPITFRDWMEAALYDPHDGYYCRKGIERWGRAGDYRTSPERTPLFAATFAHYFTELYNQLNRPERWTIVEAGAAAGHFAEAVLRALEQQFPQLFAVTKYVLNDLSATSLAAAKQRLIRFSDTIDFLPLEQLEIGEAGIIFANELLDAFPVHRVTLEEGQLRELYVTLDDSGKFAWVTGPLSTPRLTEYFDFVGVQLHSEEQIAEVNLGAGEWLAQAVGRLPRGYLVTVDYGDEAANLFSLRDRRQGTLRAFRHHQFQDVLRNPGDNDITTTVDWTYVKKMGEKLGMETVLFERLDQFLLRAGLLEQLELMSEQCEGEAERASLRANARELILPTAMGASFQVLVQKKR